MPQRRIGEYVTLGCGKCKCPKYQWNRKSYVYQEEPPATCKCGHPRSQHRIEFTEGG